MATVDEQLAQIAQYEKAGRCQNPDVTERSACKDDHPVLTGKKTRTCCGACRVALNRFEDKYGLTPAAAERRRTYGEKRGLQVAVRKVELEIVRGLVDDWGELPDVARKFATATVRSALSKDARVEYDRRHGEAAT